MTKTDIDSIGENLDLDNEEIEEVEENEDERAEYEQKEQEAREEIQGMFQDIEEELKKVRDDIHKVISVKPELVARKYRIKIDERMLRELRTMTELNELISESAVYLKNYVDLGEKQTPQFDFLKNLIVKFQESVNNEQNRRFAIVRARDDEFYITKFTIDYYLTPIHIWISKIIGTLRPAGDSAVVFPPTRAPIHDLGGVGAGSGDFADEDIAGPSYANDNDWWNKGGRTDNFYRRGTKTKPKLREFGDAGTK